MVFTSGVIDPGFQMNVLYALYILPCVLHLLPILIVMYLLSQQTTLTLTFNSLATECDGIGMTLQTCMQVVPGKISSIMIDFSWFSQFPLGKCQGTSITSF
jgi:hypothetical protein